MGNHKTNHAEAQLHDQTNFLPFRELMMVFSIMSLSLFVCFVDQNGIGVLLPSIARDLHAQSVSHYGPHHPRPYHTTADDLQVDFMGGNICSHRQYRVSSAVWSVVGE